MLPFLSIGNISLPAYGLWAVLGAAAAALYVWMAFRRGRAGTLPGEDVAHIGLMAGAGALAGAKLLYLITILPWLVQNWALVTQNLAATASLLVSGFVFYGGLLGALGAAAWYCMRYKLSVPDALGIWTPAIPLFHAFGRIGCFFAGCCYGVPVSFGVTFTHSIAAPNGVPLLPVQLVEAAANLFLFAFLVWLWPRLKHKGTLFSYYIISYAVLRFVLEFWRGDAQRGVWLLSTSQWISLGLLACTGFVVWRQKRHYGHSTQ